jgi:hypothetical protein
VKERNYSENLFYVEDNIKMDIKEIGFEGDDWIESIGKQTL